MLSWLCPWLSSWFARLFCHSRDCSDRCRDDPRISRRARGAGGEREQVDEKFFRKIPRHSWPITSRLELAGGGGLRMRASCRIGLKRKSRTSRSAAHLRKMPIVDVHNIYPDPHFAAGEPHNCGCSGVEPRSRFVKRCTFQVRRQGPCN